MVSEIQRYDSIIKKYFNFNKILLNIKKCDDNELLIIQNYLENELEDRGITENENYLENEFKKMEIEQNDQ